MKRFSFKSGCVVSVDASPVIAKKTKAVLSAYIAVNISFSHPRLTNKMKHVSFKSGHVIRVAKHLKGDRFSLVMSLLRDYIKTEITWFFDDRTSILALTNGHPWVLHYLGMEGLTVVINPITNFNMTPF